MTIGKGKKKKSGLGGKQVSRRKKKKNGVVTRGRLKSFRDALCVRPLQEKAVSLEPNKGQPGTLIYIMAHVK